MQLELLDISKGRLYSKFPFTKFGTNGKFEGIGGTHDPFLLYPTLAYHISSHYLTRNEDIVLGLSDESVYLIRIVVEIFSHR